MKKYSLTKAILQSKWISDGIIEANDGSIYKSFEMEPLSMGLFEENLEGPSADGFFQKLSELLSRLPNSFDGQIIVFRNRIDHEISGLKTKVLIFEKVKKEESYSHLQAVLNEFSVRYAGMFHCHCGQIGRHISKKSIITKFQTLGITWYLVKSMI